MSARPLEGRTVVVTRAREQAAELADLLTGAGAEVLEYPTIRIVPPEDWAPADAAIAGLPSYDWLVFTSANAVRAFFGRLREKGANVAALRFPHIAAVGPATASALPLHGVEADLVPDDYRAEGVIDAFSARGVAAGTRILLPRALEAREILPDTLRERGAQVDVVPVYRTVAAEGDPRVLDRMVRGGVDAVTFTSSSTARSFARTARAVDWTAEGRPLVASIGPVTSDTLRALGMPVDVEPSASTVPDLVEAIASRFGTSRS